MHAQAGLEPEIRVLARMTEPGQESSAMRVSFELTRTDALAFFRYSARFDLRVQRLLLAGYPLALLAAAVLAHAQSLTPTGLDTKAFWIGLVAAVAGLVAGYPLFVRAYPLLLSRRAAGVPGFLGPHTVELSPRALLHRSGAMEGCYSWRTVRRIVRTKSAIYFVLDRLPSVIVPRRAFRTPGDADAFLRDAEVLHHAGQPLRPAAPDDLPEIDVVEAAPIPPEAEVLSFQLKPADLGSFVRHHVFRREWGLTVSGIVCMGCVGAWALNGGVSGGVLGAAAGVLAFVALVPAVMLRQLRTLPGVLDPQVLAFGPEGIIGRTENIGEGVLPWSEVSGVIRTGDHLLFYYGPASALIVPRRAFATSEDLNRFVEQIREWRRTATADKHT